VGVKSFVSVFAGCSLIVATIRPLNPDGTPDGQQGRILALAIGHSNSSMYFFFGLT